MPLPSSENFLSNPAITVPLGIIIGHFTSGFFGQAGRQTWNKTVHVLRQKWQRYRDHSSELTDDDLKTGIRAYAEMTARTIHNTQNFPSSRVEIDPEDPYESARRQEEYIQEQIERFKDNPVSHADHTFDELRTAAKARGVWNNEVDDLYETPSGLADLRRLLLLLEDVEAAVPAITAP